MSVFIASVVLANGDSRVKRRQRCFYPVSVQPRPYHRGSQRSNKILVLLGIGGYRRRNELRLNNFAGCASIFLGGAEKWFSSSSSRHFKKQIDAFVNPRMSQTIYKTRSVVEMEIPVQIGVYGRMKGAFNFVRFSVRLSYYPQVFKPFFRFYSFFFLA